MLQGIMQAVSQMARDSGHSMDCARVCAAAEPFDCRDRFGVAGGSARIPFVAGLDAYMPDWMGRVHPNYPTPYAALLVHAVVSLALMVMNFAGEGVQAAFQTMFSLAVVVQLIPFVYMFGALLKLAVLRTGEETLQPSTLLFSPGSAAW